MKRLTAFVSALVCVLGFLGCSDSSIKGLDKAAEIEVIRYDQSSGAEIGTVALTEEADIKHIVDHFNALKLKKMHDHEPTVLEYKLIFLNADGEIIETIAVSAHDWIDFDGSFHAIISGELDRACIAGLFE